MMKNAVIGLFFSFVVVITGFIGVIPSYAQHSHAVQTKYSCPMHPEVVSDKPGNCSKCGMQLVKKDVMEVETTYGISYDVSPKPVLPGVMEDLSFAINTGGANVSKFKTVHTRPMHLVIVNRSLTYFAHVHPVPNKRGVFHLKYAFPSADSYLIFPDVTPAGASHNTVFHLEQGVGDSNGVVAILTPSLEFTQDGYEYALNLSPAGGSLGSSSTLAIDVKKDGRRVTKFGKYLGALGHMVIISRDGKDFLHAHPQEGTKSYELRDMPGMDAAAMESKPGTVSFMTSFAHAGLYKVWAQFNIGGKIRTTEFVISIK
jgi:hypothetical protein